MQAETSFKTEMLWKCMTSSLREQRIVTRLSVPRKPYDDVFAFSREAYISVSVVAL